MPLTPLLGHEALRHQLASAVSSGRLPQVLLLTGPNGVGKQRLALWLGQLLLCTNSDSEPCGICSACIRVLNLSHPDLHWLVPIPRPKAGDPDRQVEEVAHALEAVHAERREMGLWGPPDGMSSHGIASARLLQRRASLTASEGGWRVFIIGRAERLVPQESSPEAANALLKLLEEPPTRSLFVLTTSEPGQMLTTIRSRSVPVRVAPVSDSAVAQFVDSLPTGIQALKAGESGGSIGRALAGNDEARSRARATAEAVIAAAGKGPAHRTAAAMKQGVSQARGEFTGLLDAMAERYATLARVELTGGGSRQRGWAAGRAVELVLEARERAQGNVNPQLTLAVLIDDLARLELR